jgi:hypothetical protein
MYVGEFVGRGKKREGGCHVVMFRMVSVGRWDVGMLGYGFELEVFANAFVIGVGNDADFRASQTDFETFVAALTTKIVAKDPTVLNAAPKSLVRLSSSISFPFSYPLVSRGFSPVRVILLILVNQIFRIYRDVRFSTDQTPYKVFPVLPLNPPTQDTCHNFLVYSTG